MCAMYLQKETRFWRVGNQTWILKVVLMIQGCGIDVSYQRKICVHETQFLWHGLLRACSGSEFALREFPAKILWDIVRDVLTWFVVW